MAFHAMSQRKHPIWVKEWSHEGGKEKTVTAPSTKCRPPYTLCDQLAILREEGLEIEQLYSSALSRTSAPSRYHLAIKLKETFAPSQPKITRFLALQFCPMQSVIYFQPQITQCAL